MTVWLSSGERPTLILNKVFAQSVADLAWTQDGHTLLACSTDGRVAVARVSPASLHWSRSGAPSGIPWDPLSAPQDEDAAVPRAGA